MFPVSDDNPSKNRPIVTYAVIIANIAVFLYEITLTDLEKFSVFISTFAMVPANIMQGTELHTLFTSMFLHGGFVHIFGNMLYLYIFGDNIEDSMGHGRFILFYLICGLVASAAQIAVHPGSMVPNLGASGAVAGVLGAYLVRFPNARVHCILIFGIFIRWVTLPAAIVLGLWFVFQFFAGAASLPFMSSEAGGVAYFAHIGGFVAGAGLIRVFKK